MMTTAKEAITWCQARRTNQTRLVLDSRDVEPGDIFVALKGDHVDGRDFIQVAMAKGAVGVLMEAREARVGPMTIATCMVEGLDEKLGEIASGFYGDPSASLMGVAMTGTNGKTTTTFWVQSLCNQLGTPCGVVGTTGAYLNDRPLKMPALTTPDAVAMQRLMREMVSQGAKAFAVEASSIGLMTHRLSGTHFKVAGFTNLTRDHLDYHGTMRNYEEAKLMLMRWPGLEVVVINGDDPSAEHFAHAAMQAGVKTIVGVTHRASAMPWADQVWLMESWTTTDRGMQGVLKVDGVEHAFFVPAWGAYNIENALVAMASVVALGFEVSAVVSAMSACRPPSGRLEAFGGQEGFPLVLVDYAHTDDALRQVLSTLRDVATHRAGRLHVLFGCGGDRDRGKRALMGKVAQSLADSVVLTDDNPRTEDPEQIMRDVLEGAPNARVFHDRREGIQAVCDAADDCDVILVAGKGHENYQIVGHTKYSFSDQETVKSALNARYAKRHGGQTC